MWIGVVATLVAVAMPAGADQSVTVSLTVARRAPLPRTGIADHTTILAGLVLVGLSIVAGIALSRRERGLRP